MLEMKEAIFYLKTRYLGWKKRILWLNFETPYYLGNNLIIFPLFSIHLSRDSSVWKFSEIYLNNRILLTEYFPE